MSSFTFSFFVAYFPTIFLPCCGQFEFNSPILWSEAIVQRMKRNWKKGVMAQLQCELSSTARHSINVYFKLFIFWSQEVQGIKYVILLTWTRSLKFTKKKTTNRTVNTVATYYFRWILGHIVSISSHFHDEINAFEWFVRSLRWIISHFDQFLYGRQSIISNSVSCVRLLF